jgi:hypothetical protein
MARPSLRIGLDGSIWRALGGTSRGFENVATGKRISRRQFDAQFGLLKKQGFQSFEEKSAATLPEARAAKAAPGRPAANIKSKGKSSPLKRLNPLAEKQSREISIGMLAFYDDDPIETFNELKDYRDIYNAVVTDAQSNKKIRSLQYKIIVETANGAKRWLTTMTLTLTNSLPDFKEFAFQIIDKMYTGDQLTTWIVHVRFHNDAIPKSERIRKMNEKKKLKFKREQKAAQRARKKSE